MTVEAQPSMQNGANEAREGILERMGLPRPLLWGFVGLMLFMIGDGVETNILTPFLTAEHGFTIPMAGTLVTVYGIAVAIAAFLSASLSDLWGPRKVMFIGAGIWVAFEILFLVVALNASSVALIFIAYGLRGFGYPFFAYGFLVWISATANAKRLAVAIGWFYVAFSAGLPTLGALTASASLDLFGLDYYQTLWISLVLVVAGAAVALLGVKEKTGRGPLVANSDEVFKTLAFGFTLLRTNRKALMVMLTRTINSIPTYGMAIFFPALFTDQFGWSVGQFLILTTVIYAVNIPCNLFFGALGDRLGWSKTVTWCGAVLCAVSMLGLYVVPAFAVSRDWDSAYALTLLVGAFFGIGLAGFVPLSAIAVSLAPKNPGAAMASYNLGIGAAVFAGPLLVAVLYSALGAAGMVYLFAALYLVAAVMSHALRGTQPGFNGVPLPKPERVS
ncbi:MFS transporter [Paeniglutamicibacter sp. MACA_103]|uniref:MFS transporter n=1 Tax=Paeniglutamicibacter sp. MACA_103 TaxID=3377337 RepID=UPI003893BE77